MQTAKESLLDVLLKETRAYYLSDLRKPDFHAQMAETLAQIAESEHTLREWNDAAAYIFPGCGTFETAEEAKKYMMKALQ